MNIDNNAKNRQKFWNRNNQEHQQHLQQQQYQQQYQQPKININHNDLERRMMQRLSELEKKCNDKTDQIEADLISIKSDFHKYREDIKKDMDEIMKKYMGELIHSFKHEQNNLIKAIYQKQP